MDNQRLKINLKIRWRNSWAGLSREEAISIKSESQGEGHLWKIHPRTNSSGLVTTLHSKQFVFCRGVIPDSVRDVEGIYHQRWPKNLPRHWKHTLAHGQHIKGRLHVLGKGAMVPQAAHIIARYIWPFQLAYTFLDCDTCNYYYYYYYMPDIFVPFGLISSSNYLPFTDAC